MTAPPGASAGTCRIALANLRLPSTPDESVRLAKAAIQQAGKQGATIICFPECFVPGYRGLGNVPPPVDAAFLENAHQAIANSAKQTGVAVILGTERVVGGQLRITAAVFDHAGELLGWQDKVQLDPSEETTYAPGSERRLFRVGPLTFGVVICHEGWRYPETVRAAAGRGAQIVFHPHFHVGASPTAKRTTAFGNEPTAFHEMAAICRAAENTCFFATVNCASSNAGTTSAVINPEGVVVASQPYGQRGILLADIDLAEATGLLAKRLRPAQLI